jgi:hypothetical protein
MCLCVSIIGNTPLPASDVAWFCSSHDWTDLYTLGLSASRRRPLSSQFVQKIGTNRLGDISFRHKRPTNLFVQSTCVYRDHNIDVDVANRLTLCQRTLSKLWTVSISAMGGIVHQEGVLLVLCL